MFSVTYCQEQCTYRSGGCGRACAGARILVNAWSLNRLHADRVSLCMEPEQLSIRFHAVQLLQQLEAA